MSAVCHPRGSLKKPRSETAQAAAHHAITAIEIRRIRGQLYAATTSETPNAIDEITMLHNRVRLSFRGGTGLPVLRGGIRSPRRSRASEIVVCGGRGIGEIVQALHDRGKAAVGAAIFRSATVTGAG